MKYAVLFPGQGSQAVGMTPDVRRHRPDLLGQAANDVLGWDLEALIADGPDEALTETQHAQPALYGTAYALFDELMKSVDVPPTAATGHSLGEYTALAAAGSLDYFDGLSLVSARGVAMAECAAASSSGMAALVGADAESAEKIARDRRAAGGQLYVANLNAPGQIVLAGGSADLEWLTANARDLGVRRAIVLNVAGAFHSPFMADAADALSAALAATSFAEPSFAVYANATASPTEDPGETLADQLTSSVRFSETLANLSLSGIDTFVHIGPGDVTAGLVKRTVDGATIKVVSDLEQVRTVAEELSVE
jgi:[acyl-carrier-protein] S-malonyltransferase